MTDDTAQLRLYATTGAQDAFAALLQRTLPLVYAAALRRVGGDTHRAKDVTQLVFTALARNARTLAEHPDLIGWLFTTTRFIAAKTIRHEQRRHARETLSHLTAPTMSDTSSPSEVSAPLHAVLDDVMMELRQLDRQVILLRFHRGLRLAEIGTHLGVTENAAQKRLDRALDAMKDRLARRGVTSTAAALALAFTQQSAVAVPAGLAASAITAAFATTTGASVFVSSLMTFSKLQLGLAAAVAVTATTGFLWARHDHAQLRATLAQQTAATATRTAALTQQLHALTSRADAAEADAAKLKSALQSASTAAPARRVLTDAQETTRAAMTRAQRLIREGKPQEALDEYLQLYRYLDGKRSGVVSQQSVMSALKSLGATFPPAFAALRDLRDTAMKKLAASPGHRELISEIALLNEPLGDGAASLALYDSLPPGDPGRQALGLIAHTAFVAARRYTDALVGKSYGNMLNEFEMGVRSSARVTGQSQTNHLSFVSKNTLSNLEVLAGAGLLKEAHELAAKLLAFNSSDATRAAITAHLTRAGHPPTTPLP